MIATENRQATDEWVSQSDALRMAARWIEEHRRFSAKDDPAAVVQLLDEAADAIDELEKRRDGHATSTEKFLTLGDLAERTGLPVAWLKREADARRIPCIVASRRRMFDLEAVHKALADRRPEGVQRAS